MQRVQAPRHRSPLEEVTESTTIPEMINIVEQFPRLDTSEEATRDGILDELQKITQEEWGTMNGILATRVGEDGKVHQMGHSWSALMRYKLDRVLRERNEKVGLFLSSFSLFPIKSLPVHVLSPSGFEGAT